MILFSESVTVAESECRIENPKLFMIFATNRKLDWIHRSLPIPRRHSLGLWNQVTVVTPEIFCGFVFFRPTKFFSERV